ncbi:MAG: radical SAM protein, partial [Deltaproteobacteria bacterium]|nr:radical SAM protein [Deltaproteobacteria bacterium]
TSTGQNFVQYATTGSSAWRIARGARYHTYRQLWNDRPQRRDPGDFPLHLDIETTNHCNLKCLMCPRTKYIARRDWRWSPRGLGFMILDTYRYLIDQAADGGAYSVKLNLLGEPLLHPEVTRQVAYAHQKGLYVMMNTNAVLLTPDTSVRLLEAGIDDIFFSIDAPDRETFERLRPGARFEIVINNIRGFIEARARSGLVHVQTRATMVTDVLEPTSDQIRGEYRRLMEELGVEEIGFGAEDDHLADHSTENLSGTGGFVCEQIYQRTFITWDGVIIPCCGHWERDYSLGSIEKTSLPAAWQGQAYRHLRQAHEAGCFHSIGICRRCSVPWLEAKAKG